MTILNHVQKRFLSEKALFECYRALGADSRSSEDAIRKKYFYLCKVYHPDNLETGNQRKFVQIKEAFEKIKDAPLAKNYIGRHLEEEELSHQAFVHTYRVASHPDVGMKAFQKNVYKSRRSFSSRLRSLLLDDEPDSEFERSKIKSHTSAEEADKNDKF